MKLKNAAKYFDDDSVFDAYSGAFIFKGQFSGYDAASPDGSFQRRRVASVAPGVIPAPRRVVVVQGDRWVMGDFVIDAFKDKPIRKTAVAKKVTGLFSLLTPGQAATRSAGVRDIYGASSYLKDTVNTITESDYDPQYQVAFGSVEVIPDGYFLRSADQYFHIRSVQHLLAGLVNASCDQIVLQNSAVKNCEVQVAIAGTVDPLTELATGGYIVYGLMLDMYMLYTYQTQSTEINKPGDMSLILANTAPIRAGQTLSIAGLPWRIVDFSPYHDAWNVHIRRA